MKSISFVKTTILFLLLTVVAISCSKNVPENPEPEVNPNDKLELVEGTDMSLTVQALGGSITISFKASTAWTAKVGSNSAAEWCSISPSKGNAGSAYITISAKENKSDDNRSASIVIVAGTAQQTVKITQYGMKEQIRASLMEFYKLTDGDNWGNNENWCSDKHVSDWYGVKANIDGRVSFLRLDNNKLAGSLPDCLECLSNIPTLTGVNLSDNYLLGDIKDVFSKLGNMPKLQSIVLRGNYLTGSIPSSLLNFKDRTIDISYNLLSGTIASSVLESDLWIYTWEDYVKGNRFEDLDKLRWDAPKFKAPSIKGGTIDLEHQYKTHKYTILYYFTNFVHHIDEVLWPQLEYIYENYSKNDIAIIGYTNLVPAAAHIAYDSYGWEWDAILTYQDDNDKADDNWLPYEPTTLCSVVNNEGKVVYSAAFEDFEHLKNRMIDGLECDFNFGNDGNSEDLYKSTDYTNDCKMKVLQKATIGKGIDVVLMGDGFSDRLIADGTYLRTMKTACDKLFEKEPYKTFRDYFNVYCVYAVSKNEVYSEGSSTVFGCSKEEHTTHISGDNKLAMVYAAQAIGFNKLENASIVVVLNSTQYAGTCYMNVPSSADRDWGEGTTISYVPKCENDENFGYTLQHEACGHGFAKLADEYVQVMGEISLYNKENTINEQNSYGWWKNIDFTGDPAQVKWAKFLQDPRYANKGLGVFEGAYTYSNGVWKPTETSIMLDNTGEFNAPSREAIYYRIHKLAYGSEWVYDYEKFVEYDAVNLNAPVSSQTSHVSPLRPKAPLHSPVVINISLDEVRREADAIKSPLR